MADAPLFPDGRVLVFSKAPVPGQVKTRLMPLLGGDGCARLQRRLVARTLQTAVSASLCPVELWCTDSADPFLRDCAGRYGATLHDQGEGDLGRRMLGALRDALRRARFAVLVGTDCPAASAADLAHAFAALRAGRDVVLGPVEDGGYWLIGGRRTDRRLFDAIPWGSGRVAALTRARLRDMQWSWEELPESWDIDRPEDLARWRRLGNLCAGR
ncbi:MAG TPA: TIGR04282 family arsenosugar biosynthesis glycosyltransferase [Gammaproteobacteria bacterium]|nr:TIGR04282 family arsenosugar biosynthesis glycosyltransferase [Gammaproteobacteria bacterium]